MAYYTSNVSRNLSCNLYRNKSPDGLQFTENVKCDRAVAFSSIQHYITLTNKETTAKTLSCKFDTDKMNFEPILATTKNRDIGCKCF